MTGIKVMLYFIALTLVLLISWVIQDIHIGWGYTLGILGILIAYFVAVNSIAKKTNK
jgi:hypothetical protein